MFLIDDILKAIGKKKQLGEQNKANQAAYQARKTQFGQLQERRGTRLSAAQEFLKALQPSLQAGAPNYQFNPETLAKLQTPIDFAEAAPADVSKGSGWGMAGDIATGAGSALANAYMGGLFGGATGAGSAALAPGGQYTPFVTALDKYKFTAPTLR